MGVRQEFKYNYIYFYSNLYNADLQRWTVNNLKLGIESLHYEMSSIHQARSIQQNADFVLFDSKMILFSSVLIPLLINVIRKKTLL